LAKHIDDVKAFIEHKKTEAALRNCDSALNTTRITNFGTELMERTVTEQLTHAMDQELNHFNPYCVPLKVRKSGAKGKIKHQLTIQAGTRPSGVLSEGEQRVVAIAAFLAELSTCPTKSPIIFDDPVSSLDHMFRERVARRLVAEARNRQVVVFTHDIVMLMELERECAVQQTPCIIHTIRRSTQGPGECPPHPSRPWHAMSTKDKIGFLKQEVASLKKLHAQSPQDYKRAGAELYGKLRESWERAIEEELLHNVVQRFRASIQTLRLKELSLDENDYPTIDRAMSKCSTWMTGHDSAAARAAPFPLPDEIENDIGTLELFVADLRKRGKVAQKDAETLTEAPSANVSTTRATKVFNLTAFPASA
jgi:energy-coupling factor transporter ATP-binding protein EcfA2